MVMVCEVPGDGLGAGVEASVAEFLAEMEDELDGLRGDRHG
jgi:hypothetical protein